MSAFIYTTIPKYLRVRKITIQSNNADEFCRGTGAFSGCGFEYTNFTVYYGAIAKTNTIYVIGTPIAIN